jgi:hypothetical protein
MVLFQPGCNVKLKIQANTVYATMAKAMIIADIMRIVLFNKLPLLLRILVTNGQETVKGSFRHLGTLYHCLSRKYGKIRNKGQVQVNKTTDQIGQNRNDIPGDRGLNPRKNKQVMQPIQSSYTQAG